MSNLSQAGEDVDSLWRRAETKDAGGKTTGTVQPCPAIREKSNWPTEHRTGMMPDSSDPPAPGTG